MAPGLWQILLIVALVLLLFGSKRLPHMMEDIAKGVKGFKKGLKDEDDEKALTHKNDNDVIEAEVEKHKDNDKES